MIDITTAAGMREATRLTRAGQLHEAVAIIQRTLQGAPGPEPAAEPSRPANAREPQQRLLQFVSPDHTGSESGPGAARRKRTAPSVGLGLRGQRRGYRGPKPWSEPILDRTADIVPDGGRFISGSYTNHAGKRSYKLYIPGSYHGQPLPLVVMLHGCTQNPDDFAAGTRLNVLAEEHQCFVAYPAQPLAANASKCWNWFEAAHQQRDRGEPSIIAGLTRQILDNYRVDARRIYVAGLSAGGAMAMTLAMTYPDLYAAVGIHSGLPHAVAKDLPSAFSAMHCGQGDPLTRRTAGAPDVRPDTAPIPAIVFHGDRDTTVHPCNGEQVIAQCAPPPAGRGVSSEGNAAHVRVERGQVPQGHAYTRTTYHDAGGKPAVEYWLVHGAGHAWSGGSFHGSYTDPLGPDASQEMLRFFYAHPQDSLSVS
jgi:poly(hydroxyalkanoate) depolymerase family esterase